MAPPSDETVCDQGQYVPPNNVTPLVHEVVNEDGEGDGDHVRNMPAGVRVRAAIASASLRLATGKFGQDCNDPAVLPLDAAGTSCFEQSPQISQDSAIFMDALHTNTGARRPIWRRAAAAVGRKIRRLGRCIRSCCTRCKSPGSASSQQSRSPYPSPVLKVTRVVSPASASPSPQYTRAQSAQGATDLFSPPISTPSVGQQQRNIHFNPTSPRGREDVFSSPQANQEMTRHLRELLQRQQFKKDSPADQRMWNSEESQNQDINTQNVQSQQQLNQQQQHFSGTDNIDSRNEDMPDNVTDELEKLQEGDSHNIGEVDGVLGDLDDDDELLAEMGADFNILEYADPELDNLDCGNKTNILYDLVDDEESNKSTHNKPVSNDKSSGETDIKSKEDSDDLQRLGSLNDQKDDNNMPQALGIERLEQEITPKIENSANVNTHIVQDQNNQLSNMMQSRENNMNFMVNFSGNNQPLPKMATIGTALKVRIFNIPLLTPPPPPPDVITTEQERQLQHTYEVWLNGQNNVVTKQLKHYESEVQKLRKMSKSMNSKQRVARKQGNELSDHDTIELQRITAKQQVLQKLLETSRKQNKQHMAIIQEYKNKHRPAPAENPQSPSVMMSPNSVGPMHHQQNSMSPHNSISTPLSQRNRRSARLRPCSQCGSQRHIAERCPEQLDPALYTL